VRPIGQLQRTWRACRRRPARSLAALFGVAAVLLLAVVVPLLATVEVHGLGGLERARATTDERLDECWREYERGSQAVDLATAALAAGDESVRRELGAKAAAHFRAAAVPEAGTRDPRYTGIGPSIAYADALAGGDHAAAVLAFAHWMRTDARNPRHLANLVTILKDQPVDGACRDALRLVLLEIAVGLAPGDDRLVEQRNTLRTELAPPRKQ
jgi:hypothetical protein